MNPPHPATPSFHAARLTLCHRLHGESDARVSRMRHEHAQRLREGDDDAEYDYDYDPDDLPSKDFVVSSLDVVCGICEGLGADFSALVAAQSGTAEQLLAALGGCFADQVPEVRQSALSLSGEMSRNNVQLLAPLLQSGFYLEVLAASMDAQHPNVCNNACWCTGELALQAGAQGMQSAGALLQRLSSVLREVEGPASMRQNAAIAIGRLALCNSADVAGTMLEVHTQAQTYIIALTSSSLPSFFFASPSTSSPGARPSGGCSTRRSASRPSRGC